MRRGGGMEFDEKLCFIDSCIPIILPFKPYNPVSLILLSYCNLIIILYRSIFSYFIYL